MPLVGTVDRAGKKGSFWGKVVRWFVVDADKNQEIQGLSAYKRCEKVIFSVICNH